MSHALELKIGDVGLFTLYDGSVALNRPLKNNMLKYKVYGAIQGFYQYDLGENSASNIFKSFKGISRTLYAKAMHAKKGEYKVYKELKFSKHSKTAKTGALVPSDISFSPTTITAGTKSVLTINGSGFGATRGTVGFRDADNGGRSFENALPSEIESWSDDEIRVNVTANAGTGTIRIVTSNGAQAESSAILTITYSQINATSDGDAFILQHYDDNGLGGYTFELTPGLFNDTDHPGARAVFEKAMRTWSCATGVNWIVGSQASRENSRRDPGNVIAFDGGGFENLPAGSNARTFTSRSGRNCPPNGEQWYVRSIDIIFNKDVNWYFGDGTIQDDQFDFESVALHELGHAHLLDHVIDPGNLMHFTRLDGALSVTRVIGQNSLEGAANVHERSTTNQICTTNSEVNLMTDFSGDCTLNVEAETISAVKVFPNPAGKEIYIAHAPLQKAMSVMLYDLRGRVVLIKNFTVNTNLERLNVEGITPGVYILMVNIDDDLVSKKVILN